MLTIVALKIIELYPRRCGILDKGENLTRGSEQDEKSPQNSLAEKDLSDVKHSLVNEAEHENRSLAKSISSNWTVSNVTAEKVWENQLIKILTIMCV